MLEKLIGKHLYGELKNVILSHDASDAYRQNTNKDVLKALLLDDFEIPDFFLSEDQLTALLDQLQVSQKELIDTYRNAYEADEARKRTIKCETDIERLERDRIELESQIKEIESRNSSIKNAKGFLEVFQKVKATRERTERAELEQTLIQKKESHIESLKTQLDAICETESQYKRLNTLTSKAELDDEYLAATEQVEAFKSFLAQSESKRLDFERIANEPRVSGDELHVLELQLDTVLKRLDRVKVDIEQLVGDRVEYLEYISAVTRKDGISLDLRSIIKENNSAINLLENNERTFFKINNYKFIYEEQFKQYATEMRE